MGSISTRKLLIGYCFVTQRLYPITSLKLFSAEFFFLPSATFLFANIFSWFMFAAYFLIPAVFFRENFFHLSLWPRIVLINEDLISTKCVRTPFDNCLLRSEVICVKILWQACEKIRKICLVNDAISFPEHDLILMRCFRVKIVPIIVTIGSLSFFLSKNFLLTPCTRLIRFPLTSRFSTFQTCDITKLLILVDFYDSSKFD